METKLLLKIVLWIVAIAGLALRIKAAGWFLIIFGIIILAVSIGFLIIGTKYLNRLNYENLNSTDILYFSTFCVFYLLTFIFQADVNDVSGITVWEGIFGKSNFTIWLIDNWYKLSTASLIILIINSILMMRRV